MSPDLWSSICKQLKHLTQLQTLDLSFNLIGRCGDDIVESLLCWENNPLKTLFLVNCEMSAEVCGPLLAALRTCTRLQKLALRKNMLTGCVSEFLSQPDARLPLLEHLDLSAGALDGTDLTHLTHLIQTEKLQNLRHLDLSKNELDAMKSEVKKLVHTCIAHHPRELTLQLRNLSDVFVRQLVKYCEGTNVRITTEEGVRNNTSTNSSGSFGRSFYQAGRPSY